MSSSAASLTGQTLGNYLLFEPIGSGGMAVVYRAEQLAIQRRVAIKVLSSALAGDPEFVARFRREAETAARLEHPNIVPVYDFGTQNDILYVVMRYLSGGSLAQRMKRLGRPALPDTSALLSQIASALDYAHKNGVIHRDIKPANIMLDEEGRAYLADFGIARLLNATGNTITTGIGTPSYMAPEQFTVQAVDTRTDIYSLGVMLYVMTTGKLPFEAESQMGVAYQHINTPPVPPIDINPDLPLTVSDVILHALAKMPGDRPQTAGALATEFATAVNQQPDEYEMDPPISSSYFVTPLPPPATTAPQSDNTPSRVSEFRPVSVPDYASLLETRPSKPGKPRKLAKRRSPVVPLLVVAIIALFLVGLWVTVPRLQKLMANATLTGRPTSGPTRVGGGGGIVGVLTATNLPTLPPSTESTAITATLVPSPVPRMPTPSVPGAVRADAHNIAQVWVPAGCFLMGSDSQQDPNAEPDEMPQHPVCLTQGYWIDQYEVTNAAYQQFIDAGGYDNQSYWSDDGWKWLQSQKSQKPPPVQSALGPQQPRVGVSWYEAEAYAKWRGGQLPTEAQWEYAARGPNSLIYPWGNTYSPGYANIDDPANGISRGASANVGSYDMGKSWVNAYDMIGNVWEWTADWYDSTYYQLRIKNDPTGPAVGTAKAMRGGSWSNDPTCARAACRHVNYQGRTPDTRDDTAGIRLITLDTEGIGVALVPTVTPTVPPPVGQCTGFLVPHLTVGKQGQVLSGDANRLRDAPNGNTIGKIPPLATFTVLEGPRCTPDNTPWWRVNYGGLIGWTAEGQGNIYYLEPYVPTPTAKPG